MIVVIVEVQKSSMTNIASCQLVRAAAAACCWPEPRLVPPPCRDPQTCCKSLAKMAWALSARKSAHDEQQNTLRTQRTMTNSSCPCRPRAHESCIAFATSRCKCMQYSWAAAFSDNEKIKDVTQVHSAEAQLNLLCSILFYCIRRFLPSPTQAFNLWDRTWGKSSGDIPRPWDKKITTLRPASGLALFSNIAATMRQPRVAEMSARSSCSDSQSF